MQEHQVTTEERTRPLERPFLVLATQNPIEYEGTYPLPEAQLDRFLIRMRVGYPSAEAEWESSSDGSSARGRGRLVAVVDPDESVAMQHAVEYVHVSESVSRNIVALVTSSARVRASRLARAPWQLAGDEARAGEGSARRP